MNKKNYCWVCKEYKEPIFFYKAKERKSGRQNRCIKCSRIRNSEYRKQHLDYFRQKGKDFHASRPQYRLQKYNEWYLDHKEHRKEYWKQRSIKQNISEAVQ